MRSNDIKALASKSIKQLQEQLEELQLDLSKSRLALHANKLEDTSKINRLRKDVARVKTVITQKFTQEKKESSTKKEDQRSEK